MCDRPTISKEKGIARHQEHGLATGDIFATPEEKKLLGCFATSTFFLGLKCDFELFQSLTEAKA